MRISRTVAVFILVLCGINLFPQEALFYIQIDDPQIVPDFTIDEKTGLLKVSTISQDLTNIYDKYLIKKFEIAFPTAVSPGLKNVYYVECNDKNLGEELKNSYPNEIQRVEYFNRPEATYTPNDFGLAMGQSNLELIMAKDAWDYVIDLPKIDIAISDTYFDLDHEDLSMTLEGGSNNPYSVPYNEVWHGTAVAGCVGTITDNNLGLASVAFDADLAVTSNRTDNEILQLAQAGYRVINCSWINNCDSIYSSWLVYNEIRKVWGAIVVFGAGNAGSRHCGNNNPSYPACFDVNLAVTSVGHIFNVGTPGSPANNWKDVHEEIIGDSLSAHKHHNTIDICAPGYNISSTDIMGSGYGGSNSGNYVNAWGTSFAAPQVTGTLGLIISVNPCLSANEAISILLDNADNSIYSIQENSQYNGRIGKGRLDVKAAIEAAVESATIYLEEVTLNTSQITESQYGISFDNVTITNGIHTFRTRKEISMNGPFQINAGVTCTFDVDVENLIDCN